MSDLAKSARKAMRGKASRLASTDPHRKVDASSWTPPEPLNTEAKTGARPVSRRQYKKGGKVVKVHGEHAKHHAGRKPRKSGGKAITADSLLNRDMREANAQRSGTKHIGAFKRGGKAHKAAGGPSFPGGPSALDATTRSFAPARKRGGKAMKHDDEAADKRLIKKIVKKKALKPGMSRGGDPQPSEEFLNEYRAAYGKPYPRPKPKAPAPVPAPQNPKQPTPATKSLDEDDMGDSQTMKRGGKTHGASCRCAKCSGGRMGRKKGGSVSDGTLEGTRPTGGRRARKHGGKAGGPNVTIVIADHHKREGGMMPPAGGPPPGAPVPVPVPPPPMGGMPPGGMPPGMPMPMPRPPMGGMPPGGMPPGMLPGRKAGGRVGHRTYRSAKDMDAGSGGGLGRLEKTEIQKRK